MQPASGVNLQQVKLQLWHGGLCLCRAVCARCFSLILPCPRRPPLPACLQQLGLKGSLVSAAATGRSEASLKGRTTDSAGQSDSLLALPHSVQRSSSWLSSGYRLINSVTAFQPVHTSQLSSNWQRWKRFAATYPLGLQEDICCTAYAAAAWLKHAPSRVMACF